MKIRNGLALLAVLVIGIVFGYTVCSYVDFQKSVAAMNERLMIQERLRIVSPYENVDSRGMPAVIPLSDEQRSYVIEVLSAMTRVIAGSTPAKPENELPDLEAVFDQPTSMTDRFLGSRQSLPNAADRMKFVEQIAKKFNFLMGKKRAYMDGELRKIMQWLTA